VLLLRALFTKRGYDGRKEFHLMLILSKEPILQLRKGFLRNAGFLVMAEVILVAIFIIMLNILRSTRW